MLSCTRGVVFFSSRRRADSYRDSWKNRRERPAIGVYIYAVEMEWWKNSVEKKNCCSQQTYNIITRSTSPNIIQPVYKYNRITRIVTDNYV